MAMVNFHLHPLVSFLLAIVVSTLLGVTIEKVAYSHCVRLRAFRCSSPPSAFPSC
jgi:hypothetical protein